MCAWTMEVLKELELESWAGILRLTSVVYESLYEEAHTIFEESVWYRPDSPTSVPLLPA